MNCELPPLGWYCTREANHTGPCAAYPIPRRTFNHTRGDSPLTPCGLCITNHNIADRLNKLEEQLDKALGKLEDIEYKTSMETWIKAYD